MARLSLRVKLLGAVFLTLMPVLALLVYDYFSDQSRSADAALNSQMQTAQTVAVLMDATFYSAQDLAWAFAKDSVVLTFDADRIDPYLGEFAPIYPEYDSIAVFLADGSNAGSMLALPPPSPGVADRDYFQHVMSTNTPYISDLHISKATGRPVATAAVPIRGDGGQPIGVMIVSLNAEFFPQILAPISRQRGQNFFIVDRSGRLAFHSGRPNLSWEERDVSAYPVVQAALRTGRFRGEVPQGVVLPEDHLEALARAPGSGWVAGVAISSDVALAPVREATRFKLGAYAAVLLLSLILALWISQRLLDPIRRLRDQAIALGRGQLERRVTIETGDELQTVGEAFNAMADQVQRAVQIREEFITVASHELRTPLTTIRGFGQLLLRKETDETSRKALDAIIRSTERIDNLVQDMLEISKMRSEGLQLTKRRFDAVKLATVVADRIQLLSPKHRLRVEAPEPVVVEADEARIEMVLTNFIDNAIRYSPGGGNVDIQVERRDHEAVVTVTDHGLGIPQEKQNHVFEPFFQMYPAIAGFGGMGLGLFISKQIVYAHGGRIWFESQEGVGSSFHFSLPLTDNESGPVLALPQDGGDDGP